MHLEALASCAELTTEHAERAARSSASLRALLTWASEIARPGEGAPKVLMAIARLVGAEWIDGTLFVEIRGNETTTTISIFADHGMGIRERVVPLARLPVGFDEFVRAVRLAPQLVAPFRATEKNGALLLSPPDAAPEEPMEPIVIAQQSLHQNERTTAPPLAAQGNKAKSGHPSTDRPSIPDQSGIHTAPTVRRMVAVRPEAFRSRKDDRE